MLIRDTKQRMDALAVVEQLAGEAGVDDAPGVEHDDVLGEAADDGQVLLHQQDGALLAGLLERGRDLVDHHRGEALGRLVDEQDAVLVQQRPGDRDHLLLAARERAGPLLGARLQLGEEVVDEPESARSVTDSQLQVLGHGESREDVAVLGHVADAPADDLVGLFLGDVGAAESDASLAGDEAEQRPQCRRLADAVPAEQRGHGSLGNVEADALEDVRAREADVQVANLEQRGHRSSPTYASCTSAFCMIAWGVSQASRRPWCMTAIRSARPVTTSMWCSTISTVFFSST